jgi:type IV secretory pathway VirB10-like protein
MSDPKVTSDVPPKVAPEALTLKAQPRRTVRFKRKHLIGVAALVCAAVSGGVWFALKGPGLHPAQPNATPLSTDHKPTPDGLAALPTTYGQAKPVLGPPLPGDLGPPILERQKQLATATPAAAQPTGPNVDRASEQAQQIQTAGLFFQTASPQGATTAQPPAVAVATTQEAGASASTPRPSLDPDKDQNDQQHKLDFLAQSAPETANGHVLQTPASPYTVMAGSIIAASLLTGLDSDLPGMVTAQVTEPVYDTVTGRTLLIPQGARLVGSYDSVVAFGQSRALLVWRRIILPNGSAVQIDNLPATDASGYAGLKDKVDYHTWRLLKGIAMSTLLGIGSQATFGSGQSNLVEAIRESTMESTNQAGQRIVEKNLDIQPTITVRPGWPLRVILHKDLVLKPYSA